MRFLNKSAFFCIFFAQKFAYIKNFLYLCSGFQKEIKNHLFGIGQELGGRP